jgi:trans-feruloyl-CoA hydratase/vanillin synthase
MTYDNAEDYLVRAQEAANSYDNEGRKEGIRQFIDDKTYKPGLGAYDLSQAELRRTGSVAAEP